MGGCSEKEVVTMQREERPPTERKAKVLGQNKLSRFNERKKASLTEAW